MGAMQNDLREDSSGFERDINKRGSYDTRVPSQSQDHWARPQK